MSLEWIFISSNTKPTRAVRVPQSVISSFKTQDPYDIYVNTHYQHFERTIEDTMFTDKSLMIMKAMQMGVAKAINEKKAKVDQLEKAFLKDTYKSRANFKTDMENSLTGNTLVQSYLTTRDIKITRKDAMNNFNLTIKDLQKRGPNSSTAQYIKTRTKEIQDFFGIMFDFLEEVYDIMPNINEYESTKKKINTMKSKASRLASISASSRIGQKESFKKTLTLLQQIAKGNITTVSGVADSLTKTMFRAMSEVAYEFVTAVALAASIGGGKQATVEFMKEMLDNDKLTLVGVEGMTEEGQAKYKTTDYSFLIGTMKVGFDVKANREIYTHSYNKTGILMSVIEDSVNNNLPYGLVKVNTPFRDFGKLFAYALVNALTFKTISAAGLKVENASKISLNKMYTEVFIPIQKLAVLGATVRFIDDYLANFDNEYRKQLVILLGDNIVFLSEMLEEIQVIIQEFMDAGLTSGSGSYDKLGMTGGFPKMAQESEKMKKWIIPKQYLEILAERKQDKVKDLMAKKDTSSSYYPILFKDLESEMNKIATAVLGNAWKINLSFNFQRIV